MDGVDGVDWVDGVDGERHGQARTDKDEVDGMDEVNDEISV